MRDILSKMMTAVAALAVAAAPATKITHALHPEPPLLEHTLLTHEVQTSSLTDPLVVPLVWDMARPGPATLGLMAAIPLEARACASVPLLAAPLLAVPLLAHLHLVRAQVGTPPVPANVLIDFGSSIFFVDNLTRPEEGTMAGCNATQLPPGTCAGLNGTVAPTPYDAAKSSTAVAQTSVDITEMSDVKGSDWQFTYGGGSVRGPVYSDVVKFSSTLTVTLDVASAGYAAFKMYPPVGAPVVKGIMGFDAGSLVQEQLFANLGRPAVAALALNPYMNSLVPDLNSMTQGSTLYLGGVTTSAYVGGIACAPMLNYRCASPPPCPLSQPLGAARDRSVVSWVRCRMPCAQRLHEDATIGGDPEGPHGRSVAGVDDCECLAMVASGGRLVLDRWHCDAD